MAHRLLGTLWVVVSFAGILACEGEAPPRDDPSVPALVEAADTADAPIDAALEGAIDAADEPLGQHVGERYPASLETVMERRFLRVLTSQNAFDFYLHDGQRGGLQYEKVRAFTAFLNERHVGGSSELPIQFELIPVPSDQLLPLLLDGAADLIAARLTITPERSAQVRFSAPYRTVDELLVTHDGTPPIESLDALSDRTVAVRRSSSYAESLAALDRSLVDRGLAPIAIEYVDERLQTERILELVAARRYPYTVADSILADLAVRLHPDLRIVDDLPLRRGGRLAWATHPSADALAEAMNTFLARYDEGTLLGNIAARKYFEAERQLFERIAAGNDAALSAFDASFRRHADRFGIDWRLAAAMAFQESRFDASARNRSGAVGLFQIKPRTAREPYIDIPEVEGPENADANVHAGLKYLAWIKARYFDPVEEMRERDRLRMALAAYNAGPRTVARARRRARALGLDENRWFRHVELALLDLRKVEPVRYVSEINQRYVSYVLLGVE